MEMLFLNVVNMMQLVMKLKEVDIDNLSNLSLEHLHT
jgi:hypothetical protein